MSEPWKWGDEGKPKPEYKEPTGRHLCCGMDAEMRPFAQGDWVPYEDYARVQAELADCKSEAGYLKDEVVALRKELAEAQENYHLVNEMVARLRKEGKQS
jgi:hypothetical protein